MRRQVREEDGLAGLRPEGQSTLLQEYIEPLAIDLEMDALEVRPREAGGRPQPPPAAYAHRKRRIAVPRTHSIYKLVVGDMRFKHHYVTLLNHVQHRHAAAEHLMVCVLDSRRRPAPPCLRRPAPRSRLALAPP